MAWFVEWALFFTVATITLVYGYKTANLMERMTAFSAAALFWIASLYMWVNDHTGTVILMGAIVHLAPFLASFAWFMQSLGTYIDKINSKEDYDDY